MQRQIKFLLGFIFLPLSVYALEGRFFLEGDGQLLLSAKKRGGGKRVTYRLPDGSYSEVALQEINRLFGALEEEGVSLRLVALLDHLEDKFQAKRVKLISGYRTSEQNKRLRNNGALAASTSLHLDGMAADVELEGVLPQQAWHYLKEMHCCGAGFYHGKSLHVDIGPDRFWDEKSSGVEKGPAPPNKLIMVRTDRDIYYPGETVSLRLARVTTYPFSVQSEIEFPELDQQRGTLAFAGETAVCHPIQSKQDQTLRWVIPEDFSSPQKLTIRVRFCPNDFSEMPKTIETNRFEIKPRSP